MDILVLGMNYVPEKTAIGPLTADMCSELAARGHHVTVATGFPHFPEWRIHDDYRGKLFTRETLSGVSVRRGFVYVPGKPKALQRIIYDTSIALSAACNVVRAPRFDVIVTVSPPLQLALTGLLAGKRFGAPVLLVVQDIVPDIAISLGMLRKGWMIQAARRLERFVYDHVDHISVISQGFMDNLLNKQVPAQKLSVVPNWVDTERVRPTGHTCQFRRKHDVGKDRFVVLYGGNLSRKQGLETVVEAAGHLSDSREVQIFLVGDGPARRELRDAARDRGLSNITFLPFEPDEMVPDMLASADALLLCQRAGVGDSVLPSKLLKYMAIGRPVVAAVHPESETARYIHEANCGLVTPPERPDELAAAVRALARDKTMQERLGQNGRIFAEREFSRERVLSVYERILESIAQ